MLELHALWQYFHILLFVYWLGADLGVFLASRYVARRDLSIDERLRFLGLLLKIDLGPRTALILMVPVGFTLAGNLALVPLAPAGLVAIWVTSLAWLALAWWLFHRASDPRAPLWLNVDRGIRIVVAAVFVGLGALTLVRGAPLGAPWLAWKFLLFGAVVVLGVLLRSVIQQWVVGFGELRDPATVDAGNDRIYGAYRRATRLAHTLWLGVALAAFFGVVKPA
jgi:hypothetical protein